MALAQSMLLMLESPLGSEKPVLTAELVINSARLVPINGARFKVNRPVISVVHLVSQIVMAGSYATGAQYYYVGERLISSWIALAAYILSSAVMRSPYLASFNKHLAYFHTAHNGIADILGLSLWLFIALFGQRARN